MKQVAVCLVVALSACGSDAAHVGGTVHGLWDGADGVALHLVTEEVDALLTVTTNRSFQFPSSLRSGESYVVAVANQPFGHTCVVRGGNGVITDDDVALDVACTGPAVSVDLAGLAFDPSQDQQTIASSPFASSIAITIDAAPGIVAQLDGAPVTLGTPTPRPFAIGANQLAVSFSALNGLSKTFQIEIDRGDGAVSQDLYAKSSDGNAKHGFGTAMVLDGDTLAVAAAPVPSALGVTEPGAVYVFVRQAGGWSQQARIEAPIGEYGLAFGGSVALSNDTLVISGTAAAHVYTRRDSVWTESQALVPSPASGLGGRVAIDGDVIVATAPADNINTLTAVGAAYVFRRTGTTWSQEAVLVSDRPSEAQRFGSAVAISAGSIAIGIGSNVDLPSVYVFREKTLKATPQWDIETVIPGSYNTGFGHGLVLAGDLLVIGAPVAGSNEDAKAYGMVYVYTRTAGTWTKESSLKPSSITSAGAFGASLALAGDVLAVGASVDGGAPGNGLFDPSFARSGAVILFGHTGATWQQVGYQKASNPGTEDLFGYSVALSSDTLVVGSPLEDGPGIGVNAIGQGDNTAMSTGALYLFH